jgi:hypothetical protein
VVRVAEPARAASTGQDPGSLLSSPASKLPRPVAPSDWKYQKVWRAAVVQARTVELADYRRRGAARQPAPPRGDPDPAAASARKTSTTAGGRQSARGGLGLDGESVGPPRAGAPLWWAGAASRDGDGPAPARPPVLGRCSRTTRLRRVPRFQPRADVSATAARAVNSLSTAAQTHPSRSSAFNRSSRSATGATAPEACLASISGGRKAFGAGAGA